MTMTMTTRIRSDVGDCMDASKLRGGREQRFVFDEVAELYARVRPAYPIDLIEDLIRAADLKPGARVLELGAGPGTASVLFAGRGYDLLCLEPGVELAELARQRLASDPTAHVDVTTFEDWPVQGARFELVFAAQSFHWIDPAVRFSKTAQALRPGGVLAIFANRPLRGATSTDFQIQEAYAKHAPELASRGVDTNTCENFQGMFAAAAEYGEATCREYRWQEAYDAARYSDLMRTHSDHRLLPVDRLERLLDDIGEAIRANGGQIEIGYVTVLCYARAPASGRLGLAIR